jgi:hypothetical protein
MVPFSAYQSRANVQQSCTPNTHSRPISGALKPHGLHASHSSVLGLTMCQGSPLASQAARSAGDGVGGVTGWLCTTAMISPASSAADQSSGASTKN